MVEHCCLHYIRLLDEQKTAKDCQPILQEAWDNDCLELFRGLKLLFDKVRVFHISPPRIKISSREEGDAQPHARTWDDFIQLAMQLHTQKIPEDKIKPSLIHFINLCNASVWNEWYRRILKKEIGNSLRQNTVNDFLSKQGETGQQYLIPDWSIPRYKEFQKVNKSTKEFFLFPDRGKTTIVFAMKQYDCFLTFNSNFEQKKISEEKQQSLQKIVSSLNEDVVFFCFDVDEKLVVWDMVALEVVERGVSESTVADRQEMMTHGLAPLLQVQNIRNIITQEKVRIPATSDKDQMRKVIEEKFEGTEFEDHRNFLLQNVESTYLAKITNNFLRFQI